MKGEGNEFKRNNINVGNICVNVGRVKTSPVSSYGHHLGLRIKLM